MFAILPNRNVPDTRIRSVEILFQLDAPKPHRSSLCRVQQMDKSQYGVLLCRGGVDGHCQKTYTGRGTGKQAIDCEQEGVGTLASWHAIQDGTRRQAMAVQMIIADHLFDVGRNVKWLGRRFY